MFGFGKASRIKKLSDSISMKLRDILAYHRQMNDGIIPEVLKSSNYVFGFHHMICVHLYYFAIGGKTDDDVEERGLVLLNSLAKALEMDLREVAKMTEKLINNPDHDFTRSMDDAKEAFDKIYAGDPTALIKFNKNIRRLLEPIQDECQTKSLNKDGKIAGSVIRHSDGRNTIIANDKFDFTALILSTFIVFSDHITQDEKKSFSEWAGLSSDEWTTLHREKFAHAMMHHFYDLKESGAIVPDAIKGVIQQLSQNALPPLDRSLTNEVRKIFNGQFLRH
jgi:hypothetical protein